jgi:hypothetical protein
MGGGNTESQTNEPGTESDESVLPDLQPWREVGWFFRDGGCVAIERQGDDTGTQVLVD